MDYGLWRAAPLQLEPPNRVAYNGGMKITRRALGKIAAVGSIAARPAVAQGPPAPDADAVLAAARGAYRASSQSMAAVKLPRSTEPATRFEAA